MTVEELYASIDGDYAQVQRVLRVDRLIDKHVRRFASSDVVGRLLAARESLDPTELFESAHGMKGVCGNLGLDKLAAEANVITEEFRAGNPRTMSDEAVREHIDRIEALYRQTVEGIRRYEEAQA